MLGGGTTVCLGIKAACASLRPVCNEMIKRHMWGWWFTERPHLSGRQHKFHSSIEWLEKMALFVCVFFWYFCMTFICCWCLKGVPARILTSLEFSPNSSKVSETRFNDCHKMLRKSNVLPTLRYRCVNNRKMPGEGRPNITQTLNKSSACMKTIHIISVFLTFQSSPAVLVSRGPVR